MTLSSQPRSLAIVGQSSPTSGQLGSSHEIQATFLPVGGVAEAATVNAIFSGMVTANAAASFATATSSTAAPAVSSVTALVSSTTTSPEVYSVVSESLLPQAAAKRPKANTAAATRMVDLRNVFPF